VLPLCRQKKNFIELLIDAAWKEVDVELVERLVVYEAAYGDWLPIKIQFDEAVQKRDTVLVKQLKPIIQKGFPQTLEEFEKTVKVRQTFQTVSSPIHAINVCLSEGISIYCFLF
jgi:hypothetical protein